MYRHPLPAASWLAMLYKESTRELAYGAWMLAKQLGCNACKLFRMMGPEEMPSHLGEFIKFWGQRYQKERHARTRPGRGSKSHVDPRLVQLVLDRFVKGYITERGQVRFYPTFTLAVVYDEVIRVAVERSGVTAATFFIRMRLVSPVLQPWQCPAQ